MKIKAIKTRVFTLRQDLAKFIQAHISDLPNRSILVITSKIVALAEGRVRTYKSRSQKIKLFKSESQWRRKTKYVWLTIRDGLYTANAGIDESNADGKLVLLPKNSYKSASRIRTILMKKYGIKKLGIIITDSRTMPLRSGVLGVAVGYAGLRGLRDYRGRGDIFGRPLKMTQTNVADSLATACTLLMGEGDEKQPLALISGAPVEFIDQNSEKELRIDPRDDMYLPINWTTL